MHVGLMSMHAEKKQTLSACGRLFDVDSALTPPALTPPLWNLHAALTRMHSRATCKYQNCHLENVCFSAAKHEVVFYSSSEDASSSGWPLAALSDLRLHPSAIHRCTGSPRCLHVRVVNATQKHIDAGNFSSDDDAVHVAMNRLYIPYVQAVPSPGHFLADEVLAVFRALDMWELLRRRTRIYLNDVTRTEVYGVLPNASVHVREPELWAQRCVRHLVVGWPQLGNWELHRIGRVRRPPSDYVLRFRDYVWWGYGLHARHPRREHLAHVCFLSKNVTGRPTANAITNVPELAEAVRARFDVRTSFLPGLHPDVPIRERVAAMAATDVLFGQGGGDLIVAVFMPTHAALVVPWRAKVNDTEFVRSGEVDLLFAHVPHRYLVERNPPFPSSLGPALPIIPCRYLVEWNPAHIESGILMS